MSTQVRCDDEAAMAAMFHRVRDDKWGKDEQPWCLMCHSDGDPNRISVREEGIGCDELIRALEDGEVMYGLLRASETFDMSENIKFVYIHWIGESVPFSKKGRYGVVHGSVKTHFEPNHFTVETSSRDDLSLEVIMNKIKETSGTKSKVLDNQAAEGLPKRGFTSVPTSHPPRGTTPSATTVAAVSSRGADIAVGDGVIEAIGNVKDDKSEVNWAVITYEDNNIKKPLVLIGSGSGPVSQVMDLMQPNAVCYAIYRTTDEIDGHTVVRFAYIMWVGEEVKPMFKAKVSTHKGFVEELFKGCHVTLYANRSEEVTESILNNKIQSASGSKSHVK